MTSMGFVTPTGTNISEFGPDHSDPIVPWQVFLSNPYVEEFRSYLMEDELANDTIRGYLYDARQFLLYLFERDIDATQVTASVVNTYITDLTKNIRTLRADQVGRYSRSTILKKVSSLRRFCRMLVGHSVLTSNPFSKFELTEITKKPREKKGSILSIGEITKLLEAPEVSTPIGLRDKVILITMALLGLEVAEIHRLNQDDFEMDRRLLRVIGRKGKVRDVPLNALLLPSLKAWETVLKLYGTGTDAFVIALHWAKNKEEPARRLSTRGIRQVVDGYMKAIGIKRPGVSCRSLRNSFVIHGIKKGARLNDVCNLVGVNIQTVRAYEKIAKSILPG